jgi:hypothetical protein
MAGINCLQYKSGCREGRKMSEIIFVVEEAPEGGFTAHALGHSIFTEAESWDELKAAVQEAVSCHFEAVEMPRLIRLHLVREEVISA